MAIIGHIENGKLVKDFGSFNLENTPEATETTSGLMSASDKKKIDKSYTTDDVVPISSIEALFN